MMSPSSCGLSSLRRTAGDGWATSRGAALSGAAGGRSAPVWLVPAASDRATSSFANAVRATLTGVLCLVLAVGLLIGPTVGSARAQDQDQEADFPNSAVGIIDLQHILQGSTAWQGVNADRQRFLDDYNKQTAEEEQALREEQRGLAIQPNQAPTPELQQKARAFREKVAAFEQKVADRRRNLERALSIAMSEVQQMISVVADEVATERGINLVLYRSQVPLFDSRMNMTDDVLARLNDRLASVEFPDPAELPPEGDN